MKTPTQYQLEKLAGWDARNRQELEEIRKLPPSRENAAEASKRIHRLKKSVKEAQRYCDLIGHVRPSSETHEPGDGQ